MADEEMPAGITRRKAIRTTAAAGALLWSTPAVRSVHLIAAAGTAPPSSSSTRPSPTIFTFAGHLEQQPLFGDSLPGCIAAPVWNTPVELTTLGPSTLKLSFCIVSTTGPITSGGSFEIESSDGSLSGTVDGGTLGSGFVAPVHIDISITTGTGAFQGATGTAAFDGVLDASFLSTPFSGDITGTFTVP